MCVCVLGEGVGGGGAWVCQPATEWGRRGLVKHSRKALMELAHRHDPSSS